MIGETKKIIVYNVIHRERSGTATIYININRIMINIHCDNNVPFHYETNS